ncbi:apolipoprotein N-acyltransferase [Aliikangiella sp. IMCC44359]|uniref:apolipoprotein N-acyltransferase n=1 Tax=Aliikangiella sp. IMCC44359 TaxID=3459125 RepID=UPI00403AC46C
MVLKKVAEPVLANIIIQLDNCLSSKWLSCGLMLFTGMLYPLAFAPTGWWPLAFISIITLIFSLTRPAALTPFKLAYFWGVGAFLIGASWVYVSIHKFGNTPVLGAGLLTLLFVAYLALFKGLFGYLLHKLSNKTSFPMLVLIAPLCWVISEYLQSIVFNGFPWLLLGYSQIDSPLAPIATWFGVYGISWFMVALCTAFVLWVSTKRNKIFAVIATLILSVIFLSHVYEQKSIETQFDDSSIDVALVQPNIAQEKKWDRKFFSTIIDILFDESEPLWDADLIVWPEGAIPAYAYQVNDILLELSEKAEKNSANLILGLPEYEASSKQSYVSLLALGGSKQTYHKQVLVPFGEYVPLEDWFRGVIKFFDLPMSGFTPAKTEQLPMKLKQLTAIPAICYEIVYPGIIRELSSKAQKELPQLIVTVSNDAWFGDSFGPYQHMQMARMRSLELGLPLVRATNDGITGIVDAQGNMVKQLARYKQGSLRQQLILTNRDTPYRRFGWGGILFLLITSCCFIGWSLFQQRKFY